MASFTTPLQADKKQKCITLDELYAKRACSPKAMSAIAKEDPPALVDLLVGQVSESPDVATRIKPKTNFRPSIPKANTTKSNKRKRVGKNDVTVTDLSNDDDCVTEIVEHINSVNSAKKSSGGIALDYKSEYVSVTSPIVQFENELEKTPTVAVNVTENYPSDTLDTIETIEENEKKVSTAESTQNCEVAEVVQDINFPTTPITSTQATLLSDDIQDKSIALKSPDSILSTNDADDDKITDNIAADVEVAEVKKRRNKRKTPDIVTTTPSAEESSVKRERVSKPSAKKRAAQIDELVETDQISLLEPTVRTKLECYRDRERFMIDNLIELESAEDLNDRMIGIENAKQLFQEYRSTLASLPTDISSSQEDKEATSSTSSEINPTQLQLKSTLEMEKGGASVSFPKELKTLIARFVQGSSEPLSALAASLSAIITKECEDSNTNISSTSSSDTGNQEKAEGGNLPMNVTHQLPVHWCDHIVLQEEIKAIATRTCYGFRSKSTDCFEDSDRCATWRWETQDTATYLDASSDSAVKEIRACRKRTGRAIQKSVAVTQILLSTATSPLKDPTKLASAEELFTKSYAEVEKAKFRRLELQKKKAAEKELKQKKELEKEMKLKEKEEEARKKEELKKEKEIAEKEKVVTVTEKPLTEKQIQEAKALEKQKSLLKSFFVAKSPSAGTTGAPGNSSKGSAMLAPGLNRALGPRITLSAPPTTTVAASASPVADSPPSLSSDLLIFTTTSTNTNDLSVSSGLTTTTSGATDSKDRTVDSLAESTAASAAITVDNLHEATMICDSTIEPPLPLPATASAAVPMSGYRMVSHGRRPPRKPSKFTVSVEIPTSAFGLSETNSVELKDVSVDSRMKLLSFCQDYRPPYWGTFSKKSHVITGRNPFAKDPKLFDYDFDSEAEWEEEDVLDGEDIAVSDNEEDGEGNELEYDDFFRRDNDFGSDLDSDEEVVSAAFVSSKSNACKEVFGPLFIDQSGVARKWSDQTNSSLVTVAGNSREVERMRSFVTVLHYSTADIPKLGSLPVDEPAAAPSATAETNASLPAEKKNRTFRDELLPELLRFVHGRKAGIDTLVEEFWTLHKDVAKSQIKGKIKLIASREGSLEGHGSSRWMVKSEAKESLMDEELPPVIFTPPRVKTKRIKPTRISAIPMPGATGAGSDASLPLPPSSSIPLVFGKVMKQREEEREDGDGDGTGSSDDVESGEGEGGAVDAAAGEIQTDVHSSESPLKASATSSATQSSESVTSRKVSSPTPPVPASTAAAAATPKVTLLNYFKGAAATGRKPPVAVSASPSAVTAGTTAATSPSNEIDSGCEECKEVDEKEGEGDGGNGVLILGDFPVKGLGMTCPATATMAAWPLRTAKSPPVSVDLT